MSLEVFPLKHKTLQLIVRLGLFGTGLTLLACGGGGGLFGGPGVTLTADKGTIAYGQTVNIKWSSRQIVSIRTVPTNFNVNGNDLNGSFVDRPALDTTYYIEAVDESGGTRSSTVTVRVAPSTKKILVLADMSQAGATDVVTYLQKLTTQPIQTSLTRPTTITADLVVIGASASIGPNDRTPIRNFIAAGGRVVLVGRAAPKLATGSPNGGSLPGIGTWFAGATTYSDLLSPIYCVNTSPGVPLSAIYYGDDITRNGDVSPVAASAIKFTTQGGGGTYDAFAYKPSIGGRVGFSTDAPIGSTGPDTATRGIFLSICRWALEDN